MPEWAITLISSVGTAVLAVLAQYFRQVKPTLKKAGAVADAAEATVKETNNKWAILAVKTTQFAADGKLTQDEVQELINIASGDVDSVAKMATVAAISRTPVKANNSAGQ
jgi:hypothetical protein